MDFTNVWSTISENAVAYLPKVALALLLLIIGFPIIGRISRQIGKLLSHRQVDPSVQTFLGSMIKITLQVLLLITVASMFGIETTSFVGLLAAAGLAVGMALQGTLGNFAGGVLILLFRPFKVGDLIEGQGHIGHVQSVNVLTTTILTPDNKRVIIPNGPLSSNSVTNFSEKGHLRVDLVAGISYDADIQQAREVIMSVMENDPQVLQSPAPSVNVLELADSSVNLAIRPYANVADYWDVYFNITEKTKLALDEAGIEIPFPIVVEHHQSTTSN